MGQPYLAIKALLVPNGPGKIPSATRFLPGQLIEFDGDEPIDLGALISCGAVLLYDEANKEHYDLRLKLAGDTMTKKSRKGASFKSMEEDKGRQKGAKK